MLLTISAHTKRKECRTNRFNKSCHPSQRPRWHVDKEAIGLSRVQIAVQLCLRVWSASHFVIIMALLPTFTSSITIWIYSICVFGLLSRKTQAKSKWGKRNCPSFEMRRWFRIPGPSTEILTFYHRTPQPFQAVLFVPAP